MTAKPLIDPFGRHVTYLRVSVTDRCYFRCIYCMAETMDFLPRRDLLSLEEVDRLASAFVVHGVRKLRLTGGEPLVRRNIMWLTGGCRASGRPRQLTLTAIAVSRVSQALPLGVAASTSLRHPWPRSSDITYRGDRPGARASLPPSAPASRSRSIWWRSAT
jgi:hypothetical protein